MKRKEFMDRFIHKHEITFGMQLILNLLVGTQ